MRRPSPTPDNLPDNPALIAAMIKRHLDAAQVAIRDLVRELRPARIQQPDERAADLFRASAPASGEGAER